MSCRVGGGQRYVVAGSTVSRSEQITRELRQNALKLLIGSFPYRKACLNICRSALGCSLFHFIPKQESCIRFQEVLSPGWSIRVNTVSLDVDRLLGRLASISSDCQPVSNFNGILTFIFDANFSFQLRGHHGNTPTYHECTALMPSSTLLYLATTPIHNLGPISSSRLPYNSGILDQISSCSPQNQFAPTERWMDDALTMCMSSFGMH